MMTIEIKINGHPLEIISVVNITDNYSPENIEVENDYIVNGTYRITHRRGDGHRELARKALSIIKKFKA